MFKNNKKHLLTLSLLFLSFTTITINCYYYEEESRPTYLTAAVGDHVVFNCDLDFPQGIRIPYILNWNKEGLTVFSWFNGVLTASDPYVGRMHLVNDPDTKGYGRASVNLTSIRETDNGWYECQLIFPNRTPTTRNNGTWFYLTVNGGALLAIPPINQTTLEGEEAKFNCDTKDSKTIVTWYKDNIPIKNLSDIYQRSWITDENTLIIRPTSMSDLGEYKCVAENEDGESQSANAYLNVQYKAKVIYAPREIHLPYGRSAMLDCHFRANPPLTNLRWEKDGFLFDPYNIQGVFYRRNGSLYFSKVDESHSGYYTCTPYNDLGTEGPSPNIHVIVQRPPVFVLTPQHLYLRKLGETLELPCDARDGENEHRPIIVWYRKDGSSLPVGRYSIKEGNLTINNIQEDDRGFYQCSATNEAATITAETQLIVENVPPRAPYNLSANSIGTSIHIKWMAGIKGLPVDYSVWYKPVNSKEWKMTKVSTKKALEATISNLLPEQEYEMMVLCKDSQGNGLFSKAIRVWTKGIDGQSESSPNKSHSKPPIGSPTNVCVYSTDEGYLVTWDPPEYGNDELRLYVVRWFEGPREHLDGTAETKNTSYLVTGLQEGKDYHFQVLAMAFNDYQSASETVSVTVPGNETFKAISLSLLSLLGLVAGIILAAYFIRKKWYQTSYHDNKKVNNN